MTYSVKMIDTGQGDIVMEIADGPLAGDRLDYDAILRGQSFDDYLDSRVANARACISSAERFIARAELLKGNVTLPSREEFTEAMKAAQKAFAEGPLREAEAALAKLEAAGADAAKIIYARISVAAHRESLAEELGEQKHPELDPSNERILSESASCVGVPVRMEISCADDTGERGIYVRFEIIEPMRLMFPMRKITASELARLCKVFNIPQLTHLDELLFRDFVAIMDDDANITFIFSSDENDTPDVPTFERKPIRPWGSAISRLADKAIAA